MHFNYLNYINNEQSFTKGYQYFTARTTEIASASRTDSIEPFKKSIVNLKRLT